MGNSCLEYFSFVERLSLDILVGQLYDSLKGGAGKEQSIKLFFDVLSAKMY